MLFFRFIVVFSFLLPVCAISSQKDCDVFDIEAQCTQKQYADYLDNKSIALQDTQDDNSYQAIRSLKSHYKLKQKFQGFGQSERSKSLLENDQKNMTASWQSIMDSVLIERRDAWFATYQAKRNIALV